MSKIRTRAVGIGTEVAIVVLGVMIAPWADGWVGDVRTEQLPRAQLVAVRDELRIASVRLDSTLLALW